jgi:hypothetical protein
MEQCLRKFIIFENERDAEFLDRGMRILEDLMELQMFKL